MEVLEFEMAEKEDAIMIAEFKQALDYNMGKVCFMPRIDVSWYFPEKS